MAQRISKAEFDALGADFSSLRLMEDHERCEHCVQISHWVFENRRRVGVVCHDGCRGWWSWALFQRAGRRYRCVRYGFGQSGEALATEALLDAAGRRLETVDPGREADRTSKQDVSSPAHDGDQA